MALSNRENILRAIRREGPEWMPYTIHLCNATWAALGKDLEDVILRHPKTWPDYEKGDFDWNDIQWRDREDPTREWVDHWGCVWKTSDYGFVGTVFEHPLADISKLDEIEIPDADHYNGGMDPVDDWGRVRENLDKMRARGEFARGGIAHGFHMLRLEYLRGFENFMMDLAMDTPEINRLVEIVHHLNKAAVANWIRAGADMVYLPEDLGTQTSSILGPKMFRKWVLPYHKELHDMCHAADVLTYFHSDGNIMDVADQILEIGADVINNQDLANGVDNLAKAFKGRACMDLDFDRQSVLPFGKPSEIRELVEYEVRTLGAPEGGLMIKSEIRGPIPPENIDAVVGALEEYCTYWS